MPNHAIQANPPSANISINTHTSDWLWAVFALMSLSTIFMFGWKISRPRNTRVFHYLGLAALFTASVAYFSMASDLGSTGVNVEFDRVHPGSGERAIWFARYIMWVIATPMLQLLVLLGAALTISEMFIVLFMDIAFFVLLLIGSLTPSTYKWGYYMFSLVALALVCHYTVGTARCSSVKAGTQKIFTRAACYLGCCLFLIPICWGLSEGGNRISPTGEMVFYGIIDLLLIPGFIFLHLGSLANNSYGPYLGTKQNPRESMSEEHPVMASAAAAQV